MEELFHRLAAVKIAGHGSAKDIKPEAAASAESFFLNPEPTEPTDVKDEGSWKDYVLSVEQNVKAEYSAYLENNSHSFAGWRSKRLKELLLVPVDPDEMIYKVVHPGCPTATDSANYHMSLVVKQGTFHILKAAQQCSPDIDAQVYYLSDPGMSIDEKWPDIADLSDNDVIFLYGYIGDRMNELAAVKTLLSALDAPLLLRSVASPTRRQPATFKAHQPLPEVKLESSLVPINLRQREVLSSLRYDIEFIQGPPGTGKSTTIFHLINTFVGPAECALVSCVSNKAIDAIAEKFVRRLPFIVVGRDERVGPTARQWTLEAQVNRDPEVAHWQAAKDELLEHDKTLELNKDDSPSRQEATAASLLKKLEDSTLQALQICAVETRRRAAAGPMFSVLFALVGETLKVACEELSKNKRRASLAIRRACRAVLTTIDSCGTAIARLDEDGDLVDDAETRCIADRLALAVLDEAGTITEAKLCVIIAVLPQITRIVSIGDQQQLEPYTDIQMNIQKRLRDTQGYFHRAARVLRDDIPMLHTQFRMHPKICKLVSSIAYGGQLHTDPAVARKRETASGARAISWKGYAREGAGESKSAGGSFFNDQELKIVCDLAIHEVSVLRPQNKRLLIITFYREQLNLLRKELADMGVLARDGKTGLPVDPDDGHVRVATVDSAQGSEADCVILSMVRCNERCDVGFLANQNRAIVAISRAKDRLIIVGHKETVAARGLWRRILNEAEGTGARGGGIGGALGSIDSTRINGRMQQGQRGGPGGQMRPNIGQLRCGPCGTETYMAPEMHTALSYDGCKADVFALGVCLYTLANKSPPCVMIPQDMTAASLAAAPPEQQKQLLGERLFPLISQVQPASAGKITGMLLEMDNGELLSLLESPETLNAKIMEAVSVLEMHAAEGDVSPSQQIIVSKRSELEPANLAPVAQALAPPVAADHPLARRLRIVRKKLREIAVLEQLEAVEGAVLQANQRAKIQEKSALEAELASLVTE